MTADWVGETPVRGVLQRSCACGGGGPCAKCGEGELARSATGPEPESVPSVVHESLRGPGRPLDADVRAEAEGRLGHDLRDVRIHADRTAADAAASVHASAFTVGHDVVFGAGRFRPGTPDGRKLLLHELTHTVQQRGRSAQPANPSGSSLRIGPTGTAAEAQADRVADGSPGPEASGGHAVQPAAAAAVQRQPDMGGINLTIGEDGRVDVTVVGPNVPVVGAPALGIRRRPNGRVELLFGNSTKLVTPGEVPGMLRGALNQSSRQAPGTTTPLADRLPTCQEMRRLDGRPKPWPDHRLEQILLGRRPLPQAFYEGLAAACVPAPAEAPDPKSEPAGPETMPVGPDEALA